MPFDIRIAGLGPALEHRVRLAIRTLASGGTPLTTADWDGTRCHVVVVDADDGYGRHVLSIARRRGLAVVLFDSAGEAADGAALHPHSASISAIAKALQVAMAPSNGRESEWERPAGRAAADPAAARGGGGRLAGAPALPGPALEASADGTTVWLLGSRGRVLSRTLSDQMQARARLAEASWTFTPIPHDAYLRPIGDTATSLDAFLVRAAWQARAALPPFPAGSISLAAWPDLGAAADLVEVLRVVEVLLQRESTPQAVADAAGLPVAEVSACLCAFAASGLLSRTPQAEQMPLARTPPRSASSGVFARLARHFGLTFG